MSSAFPIMAKLGYNRLARMLLLLPPESLLLVAVSMFGVKFGKSTETKQTAPLSSQSRSNLANQPTNKQT